MRAYVTLRDSAAFGKTECSAQFLVLIVNQQFIIDFKSLAVSLVLGDVSPRAYTPLEH